MEILLVRVRRRREGELIFVLCVLDYLLLITSTLSAVVAVVQCIDCIGIDHCRSMYTDTPISESLDMAELGKYGRQWHLSSCNIATA